MTWAPILLTLDFINLWTQYFKLGSKIYKIEKLTQKLGTIEQILPQTDNKSSYLNVIHDFIH